jgi:hypothetical protein
MNHKILILILIISLFSCKKKIVSDSRFAQIKNYPNKLCLNMNGKPYPSIIVNIVKNGNLFGFNIDKVKYNNVLNRESNLAIVAIPLQLGKHIIYKIIYDSSLYFKPRGHFITYTSDGDATGDTYDVLELDSINNYFHITEEKNNFKEIKGVFSLSFVRGPISPYTQFPNLDTVRFRNCSFHLFLK